jgi:glyoxylase-like metal-dependent hydrolase (beta-lactamase superfamily II)
MPNMATERINRRHLPGPGLTILLGTVATLCPLLADDTIPDRYPESVLYAKPVEVIPNVWSAIGATAPPGYENAGHNNNLSFIVTGDGVVVVNSGASYLLATALHTEIREVTDEPVVLVINENGQGHAMLGNSYWADLSVPILAHRDAAETFALNGYESLAQLKRYAKENADRTEVEPPTETFDELRQYDIGEFHIEVRWLGAAHSAGDIVVWLPEQRLVISGDMAFHERLLPIFEETQTVQWLESWQRFEDLGALHVIPGHGHPTGMDQVRLYTKDYLVYLRGKVGDLLDAGEDLQAAYEIDQSPYAHLHTFDELAKKNAGRVFEQMEFE